MVCFILIIHLQLYGFSISICRNYDAEIFAFANRLGEKFNDSSLRAALTHKSYVEKESARLTKLGINSSLNLQDNEELSSKGASLISKFVNGYLRAVFPRAPEELIVYVLFNIDDLHYIY